MKSLIPNTLTSLNIVLGIFSIFYTVQGDFYMAAIFVFCAMLADGTDGRAARYFKVSGEFGKELDSLCDLVSFGVAPAFMAYVFMLKQEFGMVTGGLIAVFFALCGALRLARFNVNTSVVKGYFMGLPIPAGGCFLATFIMLGIKPSPIIFAMMVLIVGYLMISTVRYPDFKGKGEKMHLIPIIIALGAAITVVYINFNAVLFAPFFAYAIFGILNTLFNLF